MDKMKINDILSWCDLSLCTAIWLDHERPRISDALMYVVMGVQVWFKVHAIRDFRGKIEFIGLPLRNRKLEVLEVYRLGLNNRFIMKTSVKIHKRLQIIDNWLTLIGCQKGWDCFEAISRVLEPPSNIHNIKLLSNLAWTPLVVMSNLTIQSPAADQADQLQVRLKHNSTMN